MRQFARHRSRGKIILIWTEKSLVCHVNGRTHIEVCENRALRRMSGPKRNEVTGGWRKLLNEELHNLYSSPHIISMIKSRRMRWAGHVASMGEMRNVSKF
jgi:hypothetical protein